MKNHPFPSRLLPVIAAAFVAAMTTGIATAAAPNIVVEQPAGTNLADAGTKDFGSVVLGSSNSLVFTIKNTGDADLTGLAITKDAGASAGDFTVTSNPAAPVAGAGSTSFTVQFSPSATGNRTATLHIANNDPVTSKQSFDLTLTGTGTAPVIVVEQPSGTNLANGGTKDFGSVLLGSSQALTFRIKNTASGQTAAPLNLTITADGADAGFFTVGTLSPASPVAAGSHADFTVTFAPTTTPRSFSAALHIASDDLGNTPFNINLTGTGIAPDIKVEAPLGAPVGPAAVSPADFGTVTVGDSGNLNFTVTNTGTAPLHLSTATSTGSAFLIKSQPSTAAIAPNGTTTFTVQFAPTSAGAATGTLSIPNDVPGKNPYVINLQGTGGAKPVDSDAFGYTMAVAAPAVENSFLKDTDSDVFKPVGLLGDDQYISADLGFTFYFYDKAYTGCFVSTNGIISFDEGTSSYSPVAIPSKNTPNNFIAPFWTDLGTGTNFGGGQILYATRGTAPNRVFIVKWENAAEYGNTAQRVTFQALLYENSNTIEFQYKTIGSDFGKTRNVSIGIESRNYGITQPQPAGDVIGIKYAFGNISSPSVNTAFNKPVNSFPSAVRFTRPVVFTVESKYAKPTVADPKVTTQEDTPLTSSSDASIAPPVGTTYQTPYGTVQRFEAPEFIYLDKDFNKLATVGNVSDSNPAWYRLVNDGYSIDGQVVQGTHTFFTTTLTHDVTVVWRWRLEYAVIIDSATGQGGFGNPVPEVGRQWYKAGDQFTASIDTSISDTGGGFRFHTTSYTLSDKTGTTAGTTTAFVDDTSTRRATQPVSITVPLRLTWNFTGQVRYRFDAVSSDQGGSLFDGQAFVRVYRSDRVTVASTTWGVGANTEVWVDAGLTTGSKVVIGAFYRSKDRSLTLGNFAVAPGGDLAGLGQSVGALIDDTTIADQQGNLRVSRTFTVTNATSPTEIHWIYGPTVFRAELGLGDSLDGISPNVQLKPALPDGAVLKVNATGPGNLFVTRIYPPEGSVMNGDPLRWDGLGKRLFPARPGCYEVTWPDGSDSAKSYKVEILSGYPGDTVKRFAVAETGDGLRVRQGTVTLTGCATTSGSTTVTCATTAGLAAGMTVNGSNIATGSTIAAVSNATTFVLSTSAKGTGTGLLLSAWNYVTTAQLPEIDPQAGFPAQAEHAHYHHLYDPVPGRQAPTKLDLSATDEWKFQDLTFADGSTGATVSKTVAGVPFTATGAGRSVLLFSYRTNPDEIADGTLDRENLAVRVVLSKPVSVISRDDPKLVLGRHALVLGSGPAAAGGAYGIIQNGGTPATGSVVPGNRFVVDFWLNAKGLLPPAAVTLSNCTTVGGSTSVTCASTASVVPGMNVSGTNIPGGTKVATVTNATTLVLSAAATASGTGLSLTASNKPLTVLSTGGGGLKVTLDPAASTVTAAYRGARVTHGLPKTGVAWRHYAIHVFTSTFFGVGVTVVDFYQDGVREEQGFVTSWFPGSADSTVGTAVTDNSLRFGVDAEARSGVQLDNVRLFSLGSDPLGYLSPGEVRQLRAERNMTIAGKQLRGISPQLSFDFEDAPTSGWFANQGTLANVGLGTVTSSGTYVGTWANVGLQEVATRLECTLDNAGFGGTGYILNAVSNYNADLYHRTAEVGAWGPIFPVNHHQLFTDATRKLEVAYYENPYLTDPLPHPNVAWPYVVTEFQDVVFPVAGPHKDGAIYIASRIGSEGVDRTGRPQKVFDLAGYSDLKIYNQPDSGKAGYNPNEEHALTAPSGRAALKIRNLDETLANNPPLAAFALQTSINNKPAYTSEPWVLVQVNNLTTGEPEMAAYQVSDTRAGTIAFPRPADSQVGGTTGLAYEPAANPDDRFLTLDATTTFNFSYQFEYPVFAGDLLIPPYPLNLVIGSASMADERGGNIQVNGVNQRTLWRDAGKHAWVVSGGGKFFEQFFYPLRSDFYLPGGVPGKPVAWLPTTAANPTDFLGDGKAGTPSLDDNPKPVKVRYSSAWRTNYPKLKRGETLTYQGGEYFNENPGSDGLPAVVAMKAAEVVYDSATPTMVIGEATTTELAKASARIIRPLDRREFPFTNAQMIAAGLVPGDPASSKVIVVAERWYFKELSGSLQKRFYYDSLAETLVFRGRLNDKEGGDPNLTAGPDPINVLEPGAMTLDDYKQSPPGKGVRDLSGNTAWTAAIDAIFLASQNPNGVTNMTASLSTPVFLQGVKPVPPAASISADQKALIAEQKTFWKSDLTATVTSPDPLLLQLDSFGVGAALVPNANLLTQNKAGSLYVTIAENNRAELDGAPVSLHIIEIIPDRFRGAIKVIEGSDAFSEKITLQHNGEFGANTGDLDYEWWIRDARELDDTLKAEIASLSTSLPDPDWQLYKSGTGLHTIVFEGRPDVVLADKLVLMRYRHASETSGWKQVPFELDPSVTAAAAWKPGTVAPVSNAPFQWAGAANSPQLQADGSKRYIPQLVMGWVKRVLDRINPYEARYTDFFSNESPASYSSQIQIAGGPYAGNVALNPDKNVIEHTGLIELYRTVLARAESLSIKNSSNGNSTDGINQALLLAATRLSVLYELLAREAYSDAQDPTISVKDDDPDGLAGVASFTHAFQNLEPDLLHEELSLLRGTDFRKSYPVYNRLFWNYAKGLGEAAYNSNYNIYDVNKDGFINEDDARLLYPQGHGDAWGHFLSAMSMHYLLLQEPNFSWKARPELYSLMQNVLPVDFLDEKTFARLAAGKARTGRDIVRATYRQSYTNDPDGQWQGYTDGADKARAWGVSEWAHRTGQGAYFDWAVANALLPAQAVDAAGKPLENLAQIERSGAVDEIGGVAAGLHEIQTAMDEANTGANPLGFSSDAIAFDIDPTLLYVGSTAQVGTRAIQGLTHFEQIYERAVVAGNNAARTLGFATQANNKLRLIADDTESLITESLRQDLDYRNRLIEIFGRPYSGQIGFGKAYPEGYEGPDTMLYAYLDKTTIDKIVPQVPTAGQQVPSSVVTFNTVYSTVKSFGKYSTTDNPTVSSLYNKVWSGDATTKLTKAFETIVGDSTYQEETSPYTLPYTTASKYGLQAPAEWGRRTSYGKAQTALGEMLSAEVALDSAIADYIGFLQDWEQKMHNLQSEVEIYSKVESVKDAITGVRAGFTTAFTAAKIVINALAATKKTTKAVEETAIQWVDNPLFVGTSVSVPVAPAKGAVATPAEVAYVISDVAKDAAEAALEVLNLIRDEVVASLERDIDHLDEVRQIQGLVAELEYHSGGDQPKRDAIGLASNELELKRQEYVTALAEGFRLLREREAFNKVLAAKSQKNRYQDMIMRLTRNEAMAKYQSSFNLAARYTWLAAKAYDYETSLDPGDPAAATQMFDQIVKERQLGMWDGDPKIGKGGLAELLALLRGNFNALEGRIGLNSVQIANEGLSLRAENFRIGPPLDPVIQAALDTPVANRTPAQTALIAASQDAINEAAASTQRWKDVLKSCLVDDLAQVPEYRQLCRPIADPAGGKQPGLVLRFSSMVQAGRNFFGRPLSPGDHAYSSSQFSTRIAVAGIMLSDYQISGAQGLAATPRAYLIPVGTDYCLVSTADFPKVRSWSVKDIRVPIPYVINQAQMSSPGFVPQLDGIDGTYGEIRRHADFRMFHSADLDAAGELSVDDDNNSTRLMARSIWNSQWVLIIPGAGLYFDSAEGIKRFAESVSDIKLNFKTYSHNGQ